MLLALEVMFTVAAWKRGWKGYALLPLAIGLAIGVIVGATAGESLKQLAPALLLVDLGVVGSLAVMMRKAPQGQPSIGPADHTSSTETHVPAA